MSGPRLEALPLTGMYRLHHGRSQDARGSFSKLFSREFLRDAGLAFSVAQVNISRTAEPGTVRGLHFQQAPFADMKIVTCLRGRVFDVGVNMHADDHGLYRWHGEMLDADCGYSLVIPEGYAHGFQALSEDCELVYLHSAEYRPSAEGGLNPRDPHLAIAWPLPVIGLSERDRLAPLITGTSGGEAI